MLVQSIHDITVNLPGSEKEDNLLFRLQGGAQKCFSVFAAHSARLYQRAACGSGIPGNFHYLIDKTLLYNSDYQIEL